MKKAIVALSCILTVCQGWSFAVPFQAHTLYGDLKVDESKNPGIPTLAFTVLLCNLSGNVVDRTTATAGGRYRFFNVHNGEFEIVVEAAGTAVARLHLLLQEKASTDIRQDIQLAWNPGVSTTKMAAPGEVYARDPGNRAKFETAQRAVSEKDYKTAVKTLREIAASDPRDYEARGELGTVLFLQKEYVAAGKAYNEALQIRPEYPVAMLNLGKLQIVQKEFETAVEILSKLVLLRPEIAEAQYQLGEAYLQVKKGSKAVVHFNEALRLEPVRMADAHLRLGALYDAAGFRDRAVAEYEQFLAKRPDYPDKKRLENFIRTNKKQAIS